MPEPYVREPRGDAEASAGWEREWLVTRPTQPQGKGRVGIWRNIVFYFTWIQNINAFETALLTGNSVAEAESCSQKIFCVFQYDLENCSRKEYV